MRLVAVLRRALAFLVVSDAPHLVHGGVKPPTTDWGATCGTFEKSISSRVVAVILLCTCGVPATLAQSQTGFLNIDCGATETYVDPATGLNWVPDAPYITTGTIQPSVALSTSLQSFTELKNLRYFDYFRPNDPQMKYCYTLPVIPNTTYLLRTTFFYGNYDNAEKPPSFQLAVDATIVTNVTTSATDAEYREFQYVSQGNVTFLCVVRTSPLSTPFISGITLKPAGPLVHGFNQQFRDYLQAGRTMITLARVNYGGLGLIRSPTDIYDRFWFAEGQSSRYYLIPTTSTVEFLSTTSTFPDSVGAGFGPPSAVMQTAVTSSGTITSYLMPPNSDPDGYNVYAVVYYGELVSVTPTPRQFSIEISGLVANVDLSGTFLQNGGWDFWPSAQIEQNSLMTLTPATTSLGGPILNAMEVFERSPQIRALKTTDRDALAIEAIISSWNLTQWTGDPCLPIPYSWIACGTDPTTSRPQITAVDLSGYGLEGTLPPSFANLVALSNLSLENNNLSGPLPDWLTSLTNLRTLSIQNNNFSGAIPAALLSPDNSLQFTYTPGNPFLLTGRSPPVCGSCGKSNAAIIGGASGGVILGLILISVIVYFAFRRYQRQRKPSSNDDPEPNIRRMCTTGGAKAYTLAEVRAATMNFRTQLGRGGFGPVYYGKFPNHGPEVAVKVGGGSSAQGEKEFFNEVDVLSRVHHKNLVALVGYCQEEKQMLLYEYMHNGSLFDHLHGKSVNTVGALDWKMRLHIAHSAALGLEYLHTGCSPSFVHRDVKSSNILLTPKYDAKVADFGMTRLMGEMEDTKVMTLVMGTAGYLDPEYYTTNQVSSKSDVFSFGVVLLELLTGRLPVTPPADGEKHPYLSNWVRERLQTCDIDSILDPAVKASNPSIEAVRKVAEVAMRCVHPTGSRRPTMSEVVQELLVAETMEGTSASASPSLHTHNPSGYSDYSSGFQPASETFPAPR